MKQKNMFKRGLLKFTAWTLAHTSWITMTLSPVALGKQAEKNSVDYYKQQVQELGLDKKMTATEFWNKIKNDLPGYAYFEIEKAVKQNPNALMPKFEVSSSKTSDGQIIPVITFNDNGKVSTLQMYGDKDKFMKFNNTFVTESEAAQPSVLFQKLIDNDPKLNKRYEDALGKGRKVSSTKVSTSFPVADKSTWKAMTAEQRVSYIIYMRQLYLDAQIILENEPAKSNEKKSSSIDLFEILFKSMIPDANAGVNAVKEGMGCVVAGYASKYVVNDKKKMVCNVIDALTTTKIYQKGSPIEPIVSEVNKKCLNGTVACNPLVYSYTASGAPHCISRTNDAFQEATHWKSGRGETCDSMSRLTNYRVTGTPRPNEAAYEGGLNDADATKKYDKYGKEDKKDGLSNLDLTKTFIANYLKAQSLNGKMEDYSKCLLAEPIVMTPLCEGMVGQIQTIGKNFKADIDKAITICKTNEDNKIIGYDKKQNGACDQIRKRWLSFDALIATFPCADGGKREGGKCEPKVTVGKCEAIGGISTQDPEICQCKIPIGVPNADLVSFPLSAGKLPPQCGGSSAQCPARSTPSKEMPDLCSCVVPGDDDNSERTISFKPSEVLPAACLAESKPKGACTAYPPLKVGVDVQEEGNACLCIKKDGSLGGPPKEDQPGFLRKLFNTKANKQFANPKTEDGTRKRNKSNNNDQQREYSCKFGPNWWIVGGAALAIGGVVALLFKKNKTKTIVKTNTVVEKVTETIDNTLTCEDPRYPAVIGTDSNNKPVRSCVCKPCGIYYLENGISREITPNPLTCACVKPPTEGGTGDNPNDGGGSGGVPGQK